MFQTCPLLPASRIVPADTGRKPFGTVAHLLVRDPAEVGGDRDDAAYGHDIADAIQLDGRIRVGHRHRRKIVGYGKLFWQFG